MSEVDKSKVFGINIIKGENMPAENMLSINVYIVGAIRTLLYQTSVKSGPNPEWYSNAFFMHPVRGLHLHFEMVNYTKNHNEQIVIAIGDFDPRIQDIRNCNNNPNIQASTIPISMCILKNNQPNTDQKSNLYIRVHYMPIINLFTQNLISIPSNPVISSPFYITLDPSSPINQISPGQTNFRLPYELSAILLNEKQEMYEVINSGNPIFKGCNHSGSNICSTLVSLTQSLRFDPILLAESSIRYILIVITSTNFLPLKQIFHSQKNPVDAMITSWSTTETPGQYFATKQNVLNLTSLPKQEIKISGQFPLVCQDDSTVAVVAVGKISTSLSTTENKKHHSHQKSSKIIVSFSPLLAQFPSKNAQISPQDPTSIVPIIVRMSEYTSDKSSLSIDYAESSQTPKNKAHFPLLVPRSLSEALKLYINPVITAKCPVFSSFISGHNFFAMALDFQFNFLFSCSKKSKYPVEGHLKQISKSNSNLNASSILNKNSVELTAMKNSLFYDDRQSIRASLNDLPEDVFTIFFGIYGKKTLSSDRPVPKATKGKKKDNEKEENTPPMNLIAYCNNDTILFEVPYNFSRTKNSLIWFGLYRDAFGGWGILNIRKSYIATDENNLKLIFADTMKEILKF